MANGVLLAILRRTQPPVWRRLTGAFLMVGLATLIWLSLRQAVPSLPYLLYLPPIFLAGVAYGMGAGLFAALLSGLSLAHFFAEPLFRLNIESADDLLALALFATVAVGVLMLLDRLGALVISADIAQQRLSADGQMKDLALREINHRIRNDIQLLIMQLQIAAMQEDVRGALEEATERFVVIDRAYGLLQYRDGSGIVGAREFLGTLVGALRASRIGRRPITFSISADEADIPADRAIAMGLILNEAVSNALKHAFPAGRPGRIEIDFAREADTYRLMVSDDGVGKSAVAQSGSGLGHHLIEQIAAQLNGTVEESSNGSAGHRVILRYPSNPAKPAGGMNLH